MVPDRMHPALLLEAADARGLRGDADSAAALLARATRLHPGLRRYIQAAPRFRGLSRT
jgi:hypothetical protein